MAEENKEERSSAAAIKPVPNVESLVRMLGMIFSNASLYGSRHSVTIQAAKNAFARLTGALDSVENISFSVLDGELLVNGETVEQKNPLVHSFVLHLEGREMTAFSIERGLTEEKFNALVNVMNLPAETLKQGGGFAQAVREMNLDHVGIKQVVYKAVAEDEVVVSKKEVEEKGGEADGESSVESIVAFLNGEPASDAGDGMKAVQATASDGSKLAGLIMQAVEVRKGKHAGLEGGETFADVVTGCLRRAFQALVQDPAASTQKGKNNLRKTLLVLEKELLDKLHEVGGALPEQEADKIRDVVEEMGDELQIDSLTTEYLRRRKSMESTEKRILRFMKTKGVEKIENSDFQSRLLDSGLAEAGWHELVVKSGIAAEDVPVHERPEVFAAVASIAQLLGRLAESVQGGAEAAKSAAAGGAGSPGVAAGQSAGQAVGEIIGQLDSEVKTLTSQAARSIDSLAQGIREEESAEVRTPGEAGEQPEGARRLSRRKLLELLAEIGQELCQPLAVISSIVDMILSQALGAVTDQQTEMLKLAANSSHRLKQLADKLVQISGMPTAMVPDQKLVDSLYRTD